MDVLHFFIFAVDFFSHQSVVLNVIDGFEKQAFQQRRKTLRNSLKSFGLSASLKEDSIFDERPSPIEYRPSVANASAFHLDGWHTS